MKGHASAKEGFPPLTMGFGKHHKAMFSFTLHLGSINFKILILNKTGCDSPPK